MIDYAYGGDVVRECAIPGTLGLAQRIGRILRGRDAAGRELRDDERIDALCADLDAVRLFDGKVRRSAARRGRWIHARAAELVGVGADRGSAFRLDFQNEMLLGRRERRARGRDPRSDRRARPGDGHADHDRVPPVRRAGRR